MLFNSLAPLAVAIGATWVPLAQALSDQALHMPRVLVYTMTAGFRHDSIPTAIDVLRENAANYSIDFTFTEDQYFFTDENLSAFDNIMFIHTTEEVLDTSGKAALARYFQSGGSWTGVHASSSCLYNDTAFGQVLGAYFDFHPYQQNATFMPTTHDHPSTANMPDQWTYMEEVYFFGTDPRANGAKVVVTVNDSSYVNNVGDWPPMGSPHPIAWYIEEPTSAKPLLDGAPKTGRSFYTALGHFNETWHDPIFMDHLIGGLTWTLDGGSTKAYGVGLVGSNNITLPPKPSPTPSPSNADSDSSATKTAAVTGQVAVNKSGSGIRSIATTPAAVLALMAAGVAALL